MMHQAEVWWLRGGADPLAQVEVAVSPDTEVVLLQFDRLGINDVEALIAAAYRQPDTSYTARLIVVVATTVPLLAQQRLLKLIEEPPLTTSFRFLLPDTVSLLPTVRSRVLERVCGEGLVFQQIFDTFISATLPERLHLIELAQKREDKQWFTAVFAGARAVLTQTPLVPPATAALIFDYAGRDGASPKLLTEALAFAWPVVEEPLKK